MTHQEIKKEFFSFRNGIVAKAFLDAGYPYKHIYGLQLPELGRIARECGMPDMAMARELWEEKECRESRLLATWLFDPDATSREYALALIEEVKTVEEADMLAFRLLKKLPFAEELIKTAKPENDLAKYAIEALKRNLQ